METAKDLSPTATIPAILELITALRGENGCPWDKEQTPESITIYLVEETYELVDAVLSKDEGAIEEELGDVLFQVLFLIRLYQERGDLSLPDVVVRNLEKMIRRHPHVFGEGKLDTPQAVKVQWQEIKQREKREDSRYSRSILDSVPAGMPGLMRSFRVSERAAGVGFEWDHLRDVIAQVESEWAEFKAELQLYADRPQIDPERTTMEFGDVLFSMVNVARMAGVHPETALSRSTQKFIDRFQMMETMACDDRKRLEDLSHEEFEAYWQAVKKQVV